MSAEIAKVAAKLNENMTHAVMRAFKGGIQCDVSLSTQRALVKRGVAAWDSEQEDGADLTDLGLQVQEYLLNKRSEEERARDEERAAKFAAEKVIYDEGYAAGQSQMLAHCVAHLLQAVFPGDPHPDRPNDTIFRVIVENLPSYLAGRRVTSAQVEKATAKFYDTTKATVFWERPYSEQQRLLEAMRLAMTEAGIRVVAADAAPSEASQEEAQP
jgi:hypothetical protein